MELTAVACSIASDFLLFLSAFLFIYLLRISNTHSRCHLNIAGIESFPNIQDQLPHCWSEPALGHILRHNLEPPLLQQAAFDDTVSGQIVSFTNI